MTPDKEATGVIHPTPLYCPTCKRTARLRNNTLSVLILVALRPAWLPTYAMISNRQITPTAVGVIYVDHVTPPVPTPPAVYTIQLRQETTTPRPQEATRIPPTNPGRHATPPSGQLRTAQPSHVNQHRAQQYLYSQISAAPPRVSQNSLHITPGEVEAEQQEGSARKGSPIDSNPSFP